MELNEELLDRLIDVGNKTLNDHYHEDLCNCREWPGTCASWKKPGDYFFGYWDTNAFAIALPALMTEILTVLRNLADDRALLTSSGMQESLGQLYRGETVPARTADEELTEQRDNALRSAENWATAAEENRRNTNAAMSRVEALKLELAVRERQLQALRSKFPDTESEV